MMKSLPMFFMLIAAVLLPAGPALQNRLRLPEKIYMDVHLTQPVAL